MELTWLLTDSLYGAKPGIVDQEDLAGVLLYVEAGVGLHGVDDLPITPG
jgi:hypothetical protein